MSTEAEKHGTKHCALCQLLAYGMFLHRPPIQKLALSPYLSPPKPARPQLSLTGYIGEPGRRLERLPAKPPKKLEPDRANSLARPLLSLGSAEPNRAKPNGCCGIQGYGRPESIHGWYKCKLKNIRATLRGQTGFGLF